VTIDDRGQFHLAAGRQPVDLRPDHHAPHDGITGPQDLRPLLFVGEAKRQPFAVVGQAVELAQCFGRGWFAQRIEPGERAEHCLGLFSPTCGGGHFDRDLIELRKQSRRVRPGLGNRRRGRGRRRGLDGRRRQRTGGFRQSFDRLAGVENDPRGRQLRETSLGVACRPAAGQRGGLGDRRIEIDVVGHQGTQRRALRLFAADQDHFGLDPLHDHFSRRESQRAGRGAQVFGNARPGALPGERSEEAK
jgi:hypothetical protein